MGKNLGMGFHEYADLVEEDARQKYALRMQLNKKKKKIKARDIAKAINICKD